LVDHFAVAYLISTSNATTIGPSPSLHAPSGRTATAENRAVPVAIIARVMVARQGRTGPRSSFRGPTLPVLGPGHRPGRLGRLIRLPGWERLPLVPRAGGGFQPPARRVGRGGSAVNPTGGLRPGRFGRMLRETGWNDPRTGPLFRNTDGKPWNRNAIRCRFRRVRRGSTRAWSPTRSGTPGPPTPSRRACRWPPSRSCRDMAIPRRSRPTTSPGSAGPGCEVMLLPIEARYSFRPRSRRPDGRQAPGRRPTVTPRRSPATGPEL
jgi:hypothetical protein